MSAGSVLFAVCAALCIGGALIVVLAKNPIRGALGLLATISGIAGLFVGLSAQFLAAIQLIVYAGAVVILFVFVIMLLGPLAGVDEAGRSRARIARILSGTIVAVLGVVTLGLIGFGDHHEFREIAPSHGTVEAVGGRIFEEGLVPFELATALLIVAVVGAIAVARFQPGAKKKQSTHEDHATRRMFHGPLTSDNPTPGGRSDEGVGAGASDKESSNSSERNSQSPIKGIEKESA